MSARGRNPTFFFRNDASLTKEKPGFLCRSKKKSCIKNFCSGAYLKNYVRVLIFY
ncbi:Uncharacterized protein dnm_048130 [Desulfonema magnum]|uniref:Uncharacterized protein n=1 Tax=Desulfonema magnum TaxID=45655 RepID=A0A975GP91_9BACT|nr:Uncharacterized protein dnm_048130 [Desulfonema magnum]